jgi:DNA replication and repair protein RecF
LRLVGELSGLVAKAYEAVSQGQGEAATDYRSSLGDDAAAAPTVDRELLQTQMLAALKQKRQAELERGVSLVGPHRDDLVLTLGGLPARGYASHGESWSFALALRLASYTLLCSDGGAEAEPVLILDDVFAELDVGRRERLAELVAPAEQVIVTAAVAADVPEALSGVRVDVMGGRVTHVS